MSEVFGYDFQVNTAIQLKRGIAMPELVQGQKLNYVPLRKRLKEVRSADLSR